MKFAVVMAAVLAILMMGVILAIAHTEDDPLKVDLIADGGSSDTAFDVGNVEIWNDANNLYVKYVIEDTAWSLTETHLHVATSPDDVPQTKTGNPIPGQFDYDDSSPEYDSASQTYTIPSSWAVDQELIIAAHAVVETEIDNPDYDPTDPESPLTIIVDETAWGGELDDDDEDDRPQIQFKGENWATYCKYTVQ
ncbi:MAG: hypothetical protein ACYS0I_11915 [Planctomycetota bacterium]|jgi:hypothetical protein